MLQEEDSGMEIFSLLVGMLAATGTLLPELARNKRQNKLLPLTNPPSLIR